PIDNDIIEHTHYDPAGEHDHLIGLVNHISDVSEYGPAEHDHPRSTDGHSGATDDRSKVDGLSRSWHGSPVRGRLHLGDTEK
ncbi:unnamed protein product, partial [marine sediment metagenome]